MNLICRKQNLKRVDVKDLELLDCTLNKIRKLDIITSVVSELYCYNNRIKNLTVLDEEVTYCASSYNKIKDFSRLLDKQKYKNKYLIYLHGNPLPTLKRKN